MAQARYPTSNLLKVERDNPHRNDIRFLLDRAHNYVKTEGPEKELNEFLAEMSKDKADRFKKIIDAVVVSRVRSVIQVTNNTNRSIAATHLPLPDAPLPDEAATAGATTGTEATTTPPKKKRKTGGNDLIERHDIDSKSMTTVEQINIMVSLEARAKEGNLTSGAKTWKSKTLDPTLKCLKNHFGGDVDAFAAKYPKYLGSKFKKQCCNGCGDSCSP